jgi:hypothetical protein
VADFQETNPNRFCIELHNLSLTIFKHWRPNQPRSMCLGNFFCKFVLLPTVTHEQHKINSASGHTACSPSAGWADLPHEEHGRHISFFNYRNNSRYIRLYLVVKLATECCLDWSVCVGTNKSEDFISAQRVKVAKDKEGSPSTDVHHIQGDQIGRMYAYWVIAYILWKFFTVECVA